MQDPIKLGDSQQVGNLNLKELAVVLIKHYDLHEGLYEVSIGFQVAIGAVGPAPELVVPGAMLGVSGVGLVKAETPNQHTVDASEVNPKKKTTTS